MPCHDGRRDDSGWAKASLNSANNDLLRKDAQIQYLTSALCALFNCLRKRDIFDSVLVEAGKSGDIDIFAIWREHEKQDILRLSAELDKYSDDEKDAIRRILNNEEEL